MKVLWIVLRRGSAPVGVPAMIALGLFAGSRGDSWVVDWGWASGQLQQHGVLLVPLTAALAAWDASRDRRTGSALLYRTYPRSPLVGALLNSVGALLAGLLGWTAAFLLIASSVRGDSSPYWSVVLLGPFCFVAAVLLGAVAGRFLPRYLAAPLTACGVWLGLAYGSSSQSEFVARFSVINRSCCDVASQPVAETVGGQWLWIAGLALLCSAVLAWPDLRRGLPLVAAGAAAVLAAGVVISGTGGQLTEARAATAEACRTQGGVTVCMWPEHAADVDPWLGAVTRFRGLFADLGEQPLLYLENGLRPTASGVVRLGPLREGLSEADLVTRLAQGLIPEPPPCAATGEGQSGFFASSTARGLLQGFLVHRTQPGVPSSALVAPGDVAALDRLSALSAQQQGDWYRELVRAHQDCSTPAPALP